MAARPSRRPQQTRSRNRNGKKNQSSNKPLLVVIAACALVGLGFLVYKLVSPSGDYKFDRTHLDAYVNAQPSSPLLAEKISVYVDMSDGMNSAYATESAKKLLQNVINKLAADKNISFFGLADQKIFPLEKSHTELYNYMLNPNSYDKQKAPIQQTLNSIVEQQQPAVLMTDFEEYKGGVIEHAAYAKESFIDWLRMGFSIYFYKWDFIENGKNKKMFITVFDDNACQLVARVQTAIELSGSQVDRFVLGGHNFAYPIVSTYPSLSQGGNYRNKDGKDLVTNVMENGGPSDYISYSKTQADATNKPGSAYASLDNLSGHLAEYYPIGVTWENALKNAAVYNQAGIDPKDKFSHLLQKLFVDFGAQNGYSITGIEVRTFDMQQTMQKVAGLLENKKEITPETLNATENPEINAILTAATSKGTDLPAGWEEICVDFDPKFDGTFIGGYPSTDLIRANIVISAASANVGETTQFFGWPGNPSLADSVTETLTAGTSSPIGRILYTYYLKTITQ